MASNHCPLISDPHAPTSQPDAESVNGGDYYPAYADSEREKSGSGAPATPSSKRTPFQHQYYCNSSKRQRPNGKNGSESERNASHTVDYRADYRKDREEWSEMAISCLLEAYREKYNQLNRGNLRGRDWEEVAEAVSERGGISNKKSVEQCKNKIDNLKKRYKVELQRINSSASAGGGGGSSGVYGSSTWHWFKQIEAIIGNSSSGKSAATGSGASSGGGEREGGGAIGGNGSMVLRQAKRCNPINAALANDLKSKTVPNLKWRRVVFKISGAALSGNCQNIDPKVAMLIAREVAAACRVGLEVAIVVGGRNFFCGDSWISATSLDRPVAYQIGVLQLNSEASPSMMATVMNSILLQSALEKLAVQTRVQSAFAITELVEPYNRQRAIRHLEKGRVVIFGGVGAGAGNPLFTTDTAAALRASESIFQLCLPLVLFFWVGLYLELCIDRYVLVVVNADALLKGTNVNGIYDCHPNNSNAILDQASFREVAARGVNSMDMMAITYCEENEIPVVIFNLHEPGNISRALCGDQVGTLIGRAGIIS